MENKKTVPVVKTMLSLFYTRGLYEFFTKTVAAVFSLVYPILKKLSHNGKDIKTARGNDAAALVSGLWVVNHFKRKLEGICSISSSVHDNCFCKARQKIIDCICKYCYAAAQQSYQTGLKEHNILNGIILRNVLIPVNAFKALVIIFPYLRIESFGDVSNVIQARNYIRIIKAFPGKRCAIWSKNLLIWEKAFEIEGKPANTTFVYSSSKLNVVEKPDLQRFSFIDHIFTVFDKAYAKKHNIVINCGGRKCLDCIIAGKACYHRGTEFYINELKK